MRHRDVVGSSKGRLRRHICGNASWQNSLGKVVQSDVVGSTHVMRRILVVEGGTSVVGVMAGSQFGVHLGSGS